MYVASCDDAWNGPENAWLNLITTLTSFGPVMSQKHTFICSHKQLRNTVLRVCILWWTFSIIFSAAELSLGFLSFFTVLIARYTVGYILSPSKWNLWLSHVVPISWKCWVAADIAWLWEGRGKSYTTIHLSTCRNSSCCNVYWVSTFFNCKCLS